MTRGNCPQEANGEFTGQVTHTDFARAWHDWHLEHEARRTAPLGALAATELIWLGAEPQVLRGAPGAWSLGRHGPEVELAPGESVALDGEVITGRHRFGPLAGSRSLTVGFTDGSVEGAVEIARRQDYTILRPRRSDHPYLADFPGTPAYAPEPRWAVPAHLHRYEASRTVRTGSAVPGLTHGLPVIGELRFELEGQALRLAVAGGVEGYSVLFTDATSGVTTYGASRSLWVAPADERGETIIDFNRAVNLPCAYTDFATCPLPPPGNRLPVAVEAGERLPHARVTAAEPVVLPPRQ